MTLLGKAINERLGERDMSKLKTRLEYVSRCRNCGNSENYILRDTNVNTNITDDDAIRIASSTLGESDSMHCEACRLFTLHDRVAFNLPALDKTNE